MTLLFTQALYCFVGVFETQYPAYSFVNKGCLKINGRLVIFIIHRFFLFFFLEGPLARPYSCNSVFAKEKPFVVVLKDFLRCSPVCVVAERIVCRQHRNSCNTPSFSAKFTAVLLPCVQIFSKVLQLFSFAQNDNHTCLEEQVHL